MQALNKQIIRVFIAIALLLPMGAVAQKLTSSVNTYSPYSMYGLGELATPGNVAMRSMGGIGVAMYSQSMVNMLNPAGYGNVARQSFLFNFGIDAGHYRNSQTKYTSASTSEVKTAYNSVNFHDIAFQFPLAKGLGVGFSLSPYSNVGYNMYGDDLSQDVAGNLGRVQYQYYGEGDVTQVKFGVGWRPIKRMSVGVAMLYYWGDIMRHYRAAPENVITGSGIYSSTTGIDTYDVSKFKMQAGIQVHPIMQSRHMLTLGATYDLGGDLTPSMTEYVYVDNVLSSVVRKTEDDALPLRLPQQMSAGVYYQSLSIRAGVDYVYQNWGSQNDNYMESDGVIGIPVTYTDTHTVKAGFEIVPKGSDVRHYYNRMAYRVGFSYGDYYQTFAGSNIRQMSLTAGLGLPVRLFGNSSVDVGFEFGMRNPANEKVISHNKTVGLVKQRYYKVAIGLTLFGEDRWFQRHKFN